MARYYMISNRNITGTILGPQRGARVTYWLSDGAEPLDTLAGWGGKPVSGVGRRRGFQEPVEGRGGGGGQR
jgi:hypothetical protein